MITRIVYRGRRIDNNGKGARNTWAGTILWSYRDVGNFLIGHVQAGKTNISSARRTQADAWVIVGPVVNIAAGRPVKVYDHRCAAANGYIVGLVEYRRRTNANIEVLRSARTACQNRRNRDNTSRDASHTGGCKINVPGAAAAQSNGRVCIGPVKGRAAGPREGHTHRITAANTQIGWIIHRWGRVDGDGKGLGRTWAGAKLGAYRNIGNFLIGHIGAGKANISST